MEIYSVDGDETIFGGTTKAFQMWLPTQGCPFDMDVYRRTHSWNEAAGGKTTPHMNALYVQFLLSDDCPPTYPIPGAQRALQGLRLVARTPLVTARPEQVRDKTFQELQRHFGDCITEGVFGTNGTKHEVVGKSRHRAHVDDNLRECQWIAQHCPDALALVFPSEECPGHEASNHSQLFVPKAAQCSTIGISAAGFAELQEQAWAEITGKLMDLCSLLNG